MGGRPPHLLATADSWFWPHVDRSAGDGRCWPWRGRTERGYGRIWVGGKQLRSHQIAYRLLKGPPKRMVLHKCGNRRCCNGDHLYDGTTLDNTRDRRAMGVSTSYPGERGSAAKFTNDQARKIRASLERSSILAARYSVTRQTIWHIRTAQTYRNVALRPDGTWRMAAPCADCPFNETGPGRILRDSLKPGRFSQILVALRHDGHFQCHKTGRETGDGSELLCAGALAWQEQRGLSSQYVRIAERLGLKGAAR